MHKSVIFSHLGAFWGIFDPKKPPREATGVMPKKFFSYFFTHIMLKVCAKFQKIRRRGFWEKCGRTNIRTNERPDEGELLGPIPPSSGDQLSSYRMFKREANWWRTGFVKLQNNWAAILQKLFSVADTSQKISHIYQSNRLKRIWQLTTSVFLPICYLDLKECVSITMFNIKS